MRHVISVGGGLSSTMELPERVIAVYGRSDVELVMCRLPNEDPDVWKLVSAVEDRLQVQVKMIGLGLTPWDIFFKERLLGNSQADPCSKLLKRKVLERYMKANYHPADTMLHVGVTHDEIDRMLYITKNWKQLGWKVDAPLDQDLSIDRQWLMDKCQRVYGFVPRLYLMGMSHNNCGGACIKSGFDQWARVLWYLPDVYEWWETNEKRFRLEIGEYTILRSRAGKVTTPLTLTEFRERMEARWVNRLPGIDPFDGLEQTPGCRYCEAM